MGNYMHTFQNMTDNNTNEEPTFVRDENVTYSFYRKKAILNWLRSQKGNILTQDKGIVAIKILLSVAVIAVLIYGLLYKQFNLFYGSSFYNGALFFMCICSILSICILGIRRSYGLLSMVALIVISSYLFKPTFILLFYFRYGSPLILKLLFSCGLTVFFVVYISKYLIEILNFTKFKIYIREENIIHCDLFLDNYRYIQGMNNVCEITINSFEECYTHQKMRRIFSLVNLLAICSGEIFAGYKSNPNMTEFTLYIYSRDKHIKSTKKILQLLLRWGFSIQGCKKKIDRTWEMYQNELYPDDYELSSISTRDKFEELFIDDIELDRPYDLIFFAYYNTAMDIKTIQSNIKYYGFTMAHCDNMFNEENYRYKYRVSFITRSYATPRRLEYLNDVLIKNAKETNGRYTGEWTIIK